MHYSRCPDCNGSIPDATGFCEDCGFDLVEYCNEYNAWLDSLPPTDVYEDQAA